MSAAAINATPSTTKVGFLRGLKEYDCTQTLSSITAKTTIISGGADKLTPTCHARELADGIPGARLVHRPTAGHTLLHEIPQVVTGAISSAIAAGSAVLVPGSQVSRLAQSDAVARIVDYDHSGTHDPGASGARLRRVDADGNRRCDSDLSAAGSWWMHEDHKYGAGEGSHETRKVLISKGIRHV
jgi:hypothetical protein